MRPVLAYVADLEGRRIVELLLNREVPLMSHGGLNVRIPHPEQRLGKRVGAGG